MAMNVSFGHISANLTLGLKRCRPQRRGHCHLAQLGVELAHLPELPPQLSRVGRHTQTLTPHETAHAAISMSPPQQPAASCFFWYALTVMRECSFTHSSSEHPAISAPGLFATQAAR